MVVVEGILGEGSEEEDGLPSWMDQRGGREKDGNMVIEGEGDLVDVSVVRERTSDHPPNIPT